METLINNQTQLLNAIKSTINVAIDYVMRQIYEENKNLIQEIVYNAYSPEYYKRTYELRDNWNYSIKDSRFSVSSEFGLDTESMTFNAEDFIHGNPISGDLREHIANMVIKGEGYFFGREQTRFSQPRDFWSPLIKKLDSGKIEEWFNYKMKEEGF